MLRIKTVKAKRPRIAFLASSIFLAICIAAFPTGSSRSCGPFLSYPVLTFMTHPDLPLADFAAGKLSVIEPSYARSYLVVAYRYLSGESFNAAEQKALDSVWTYRISGRDNWDNLGSNSDANKWRRLRLEYSDPSDTARQSYIDNTGSDYKYYNYKYYNYEAGFNDATWKTARETLLARVAKYGRSSPEVKSWIEGENVLLDPVDTEHIPTLSTESASVASALDREYQNAVGYFYTERYDVAVERFSHIANENISPWQATAAYMIVRCHIRKAVANGDSIDITEADAARKQIELIQHDVRFSSMKRPAQRLLGYLLNRIEPEKRAEELAARLTKEHHPETLFNDLIDYTMILDRIDPSPGAFNETSADHPPYKGWLSEMTDWITTMQHNDEKSTVHALERWHATQSPAWLAAALTKASGLYGESDQQLIDAAWKLEKSSPAYLHCQYHALRLMINRPKRSEARRMIDNQLANRTNLTVGAINLFRSLRLCIDGTLYDWTNDASATPATVTDESDWTEGLDLHSDSAKAHPQIFARVLDNDATQIINAGIPLSTLYQLAISESLPIDVRRDIANVGWTRSYFLANEALAQEFAKLMVVLSPSVKKFGEEYLTATTALTREEAAIDLIVHAPGLELWLERGIRRTEEVTVLDDLRDNWWCAYQAPPEHHFEDFDAARSSVALPKASLSPNFLTKTEIGQAAQELEILHHVPTAPNFLIRHLLDWAKRVPNDPRIPEDLHRAVVASHIGCSDSTTTPLSKAAWKLLHSQFKNSPWTKKTRYFY